MTAKSHGSWGGARPGAGRPKGSGQGPSPDARRHRIGVMLTATELRQLRAHARSQRKPIATAAHALLTLALRIVKRDRALD